MVLKNILLEALLIIQNNSLNSTIEDLLSGVMSRKVRFKFCARAQVLNCTVQSSSLTMKHEPYGLHLKFYHHETY